MEVASSCVLKSQDCNVLTFLCQLTCQKFPEHNLWPFKHGATSLEGMISLSCMTAIRTRVFFIEISFQSWLPFREFEMRAGTSMHGLGWSWYFFVMSVSYICAFQKLKFVSNHVPALIGYSLKNYFCSAWL